MRRRSGEGLAVCHMNILRLLGSVVSWWALLGAGRMKKLNEDSWTPTASGFDSSWPLRRLNLPERLRLCELQ